MKIKKINLYSPARFLRLSHKAAGCDRRSHRCPLMGVGFQLDSQRESSLIADFTG